MNNNNNSSHSTWYTLKNTEKLGPFTFQEMIVKLQNKELANYDYAWAPHLEQWTTISDIPQFSTEQIIRILKDPSFSKLVNRRQQPRIALNLLVYAHDEQRIWTGNTETVSYGGALITMANPLLRLGEEIVLHFRQQPAVKESFNLTGKILSKRMKRGALEYDSTLEYVVKFPDRVPGKAADHLMNWISTFQHI